jgi:hypothetical protein
MLIKGKRNTVIQLYKGYQVISIFQTHLLVVCGLKIYRKTTFI